MHKSAGQLNQALKKQSIGAMTFWKPKFLQDIVCLIKQLAIKAFEVTQIVRRQRLALVLLYQCRNLRALLAHNREVPSSKLQAPEKSQAPTSKGSRRSASDTPFVL